MKNILLPLLLLMMVIHSCNSQTKPLIIKKNKPMQEIKLKSIPLFNYDYRISSINGKLFDIKEETFLIDGSYTIYVNNCVEEPNDIVGSYDVEKKGVIKDGKYQKKWIYYSSKNQKVREENFDNNGFLNGNYIVYNDKKEVLYKTKFIHGSGYYKDYCYKLSKIKEEGNIINGYKEGEWKFYFLDKNDNSFKVENFIKGELIITK
jgi:antitoxin component YwqK of YwqJK toxin-antitoxin module